MKKIEKPSDSDEVKALVRQAKAGDKQAYRFLVERYQTRAFRIAYDIVGSREDAQDIVQESFVKAYLSLKNFKEESAFYTWFYRIVYNMAIDLKRKHKRRGGDKYAFEENHLNNISPEASYSTDGVETPLDVISRKEKAKRIGEILGAISEEHRTVMMLREIEGLSYDRIAEIVGISKGTVMSRLHYARKKLQEGLRDLRGVIGEA